MKKMKGLKRTLAAMMAVALIVTGLPEMGLKVQADNSASTAGITTVADPETLTRPVTIYGENTQNAGKITVGKSVSDEAVTLEAGGAITPADNNFIVTLSQSAQVAGLSTEIPVPIDAVFVLDTSGSMEDDGKAEAMVTAANNAISTLLSANEHNRVAVVGFSSNGYGGGTSDNRAASVLSTLYHYTGTAAALHLQWVTSEGSTTTNQGGQGGKPGGPGGNDDNSKDYIAGRTVAGERGNYRHGKDGGTNIQAGIALGAQQLLSVTDKTVNIDGQTVTRLPFIVVLSDGAPTFSAYERTGNRDSGYNAENWYALDLSDGVTEQGPGSDSYEGNGFLAALTAAYYKGKITEYYFGTAASEDNRCSIYTIGVGVDSLENQQGASNDDTDLAQITLDPATYTTGDYAAANATSYWNYGNTANEGNAGLDSVYGWKSYWTAYQAGTAFTVRVDREWEDGRWVNSHWVDGHYEDELYAISAPSIADTKDYVNGDRVDANGNVVNMYEGGIAYNDGYFASSNASGLNAAFEGVVNAISLKAISSPTMVTTSADFSGYVHFYDIIGEYMEVKDVRGIVDEGHYFQGKSFAQKMVNFGTAGADAEFDAAVINALNGRLGLSDSNAMDAAAIKEFVSQAVASGNQLQYNADGTYDNSLCWWGNSYTDEHGDQQMQMLGFAADDSVEYITDTATQIPANADYVCRSYYFYGAAGGEIDPIDNFLLLAVRVETSLTDPYQQTVVVSIPASLLSVDRVFITEKDGKYTAEVEAEDPMRIVYEVGLRSDINAQNVDSIVGDAYKSEMTADKSTGSEDNYDAATDTYYFYTNDWDRTKTEASHERAMTKAGFDVSTDNGFYTYQEDTKLYTKSGDAYTPVTSGVTAGKTYYYQRVYYDWTGKTANTDGTYNCEQKTVWVQVTAPANQTEVNGSVVKDTDGVWCVKKGIYTASSLQVTGDDTTKTANSTATSAIVAHPRRTNSLDDSHYTVYLGNNGRLALTADKTKSVALEQSGSNSGIADADGYLVTVGDELIYTIKVVNNEGAAADAVVTDKVPVGTELVKDPADNNNYVISDGGSYDEATGVITWNIEDIPAGETVYVSFKVRVTEAALQSASSTLENTGSIKIGNNPAYNTNTTKNPPVGKTVAGENVDISAGGQSGIQVGQTLTYHIYWSNPEEAVSDVIIMDKIPEGTVYVTGTASDGGYYTNGTLTWTLSDVQPGARGVVTFKVIVDADAKSPIVNGATIQIGENGPKITTNSTEVDVLTGDIRLSKSVVNGGADYKNLEFEVSLATAGSQMGAGYGQLNGTYDIYKNNAKTGTVTFVNGMASESIKIKAGEALTIKGLPAGLMLIVSEKNVPRGYTASYMVNAVAMDNAQVQVKPGADVAEVEIINTYSATPGTFQLTGTKVFNSDDHNFAGATFAFEVWTADVNWNKTGTAPATSATAVVSSGKGSREATFKFAQRTFDKEETLYYVIDELKGNMGGVTYDQTQYGLKLDVVDNGQGALNVVPTVYKYDQTTGTWMEVATGTAVTGETVQFINSYKPAEATLTLNADKVLKNRTLETGEFGFVVLEGTTEVAAAVNDASGNVKFTPITYYQTGTHTYIVKEVVPEDKAKLHNVTYDESSYEVTVNVTDTDGTLKAEVTSVKKDNVDDANKEIAFTNVYVPDDISINLTAKKELEGAELKAGAFTFEVLNSAGTVVSSASNDASGNIQFPAIHFAYDTSVTYPQTFTYTVKEVVPTEGAKDPYMTYDGSEYKVIVEITYVNAILNAAVTSITKDGSAVSEIAFKNVKNAESISVTPVGWKNTTVSGGDILPGSTFSFSVINASNNHVVYTGIANASVSGSDIAFTSLEYTNPMQGSTLAYDYWIVENQSAGDNGITYDNGRYRWHVEVTNNNGKLELSQTYYQLDSDKTVGSTTLSDYNTILTGKPTFTNEYAAEGYLNITAKKVLENKNLENRAFAFRLKRVDTNEEVEGYNDADGNITFATLYYSAKDFSANETTKTIQYEMSEIIPEINKIPGVTYDTNKYTLYVQLTHDGAGNIQATLLDANQQELGSGDASGTPVNSGIKFKNVYKVVTGTNATINAYKSLSGRDLSEGEFTFNLYYLGETKQLVASAKNGASDSAGVETVSFVREYLPTAVKFPSGQNSVTYKYVVEELNENKGGIEYSTAQYYVLVTVTDNKDGTMSSDVQYYSDEAFQNKITLADVVFTNKYTAQNTSYRPEAWKNLEGRTLAANEFSFEVREWNADNTIGERVSVGISDASGKIAFTPIGYEDVAGTGEVAYKYIITELPGSLGGVKYSTEDYYLKVTVKDNGQGILTATPEYYADSTFTEKIDIQKVVFTNTYSAPNGTVILEAAKVLNGRDMLAEEFDFVVKDAAGNTVAYGDNATEAADGSVATVSFSSISYTLKQVRGDDNASSRSFEYWITEIKPVHLNGIAENTQQFKVVVTVTDTGAGKLETSVQYYSEGQNGVALEAGKVPTFTNTYTPAPTTLTLTASKLLKEKKLFANEFSFNLYKDSIAAENVVETVKNAENGAITFATLHFDMAGTYTYYVQEVIDNTKLDNYIFDDTTFKVVVSVIDDELGALRASAKYYIGEAEVQNIAFANQYLPGSVIADLNAAIGATKKVVDADNNEITDYSLEGFEFIVKDFAGNEVNRGTSVSSGDVVFNDFTFTKADEYRYTISEIPSNKPGVTDDLRQWEVHIHVKYNPDITGIKDIYDQEVGIGKLYIAELSVYAVNRAVAGVESTPDFINTYTATPASLTLTAEKELTGRTLKDKEFLFRVMNGDVIVAEARNDAKGKIGFNLTFDKVGTYEYKIVEVIPSDKALGVTYSEAVKTITVEVVDDYSGQLKIKKTETVAVASDIMDAGKFVNTYAPVGEAVVYITAKKVLNGAELTANAFAFELVDENGAVAATVKNYADGNIVFPKMSFDAADMKDAQGNAVDRIVKTYTIREVAGTDVNMTYDKSEYTVTVTITDDKAGKLLTNVEYGTATDTAPVFTNTYTEPTPPPTPTPTPEPDEPKAVVKLEGSKKFLGGSMTDGQFQFLVQKADKTACGSGVSMANGNIEFTEMAFDENEVGKHVLTISEVNDGQKGITYDSKKLEVVVDVYNEYGTLKAKVYYPEGGLTFTNTTAGYHGGTSPDTGDNSPIMLVLAALLVCGGGLGGLLVWRKKKGQKN